MSEAEKDDDLDSVFNEMASSRESDEALPDPEAKEDEPEIKPDVKEELAEDKPADDGDKPADKPEVKDEVDPFKGWPQEAIDQFKESKEESEKLKHRLDSDAGRLRSFQVKSEELSLENAKLNDKLKDSDISTDDITAALASSEDWDEFKDEHPEIAEAIDSRINGAMGKHSERVQEVIDPVIKNQQNNHLQDASIQIEKIYPSWQNDVQTDDFHEWRDQQSAVVRSLGASDDASDALSLIDLYDTYRISKGMPSLKPALNKDDDSNKEEANELEKRREQQKKDGLGLESKPAAISEAGDGLDAFDRIWNAEAKRRDRLKA